MLTSLLRLPFTHSLLLFICLFLKSLEQCRNTSSFSGHASQAACIMPTCHCALSSFRRTSWGSLGLGLDPAPLTQPAKLVVLATLPSLPSIPRYLTILVILTAMLKYLPPQKTKENKKTLPQQTTLSMFPFFSLFFTTKSTYSTSLLF